MLIEDYFEEFVTQLEQYTGGEFSAAIRIEYEEPEWGTFDDTMVLPNGYKFDVQLTVDFRAPGHNPAYPEWGLYSFHLRSADDQTVWRFDNAPHHPRVPGYPDHKHEGPGELAVGSGRVGIPQLIDEIAISLGY